VRTTTPLIPLDRREGTPLHRQIYRGLREAILSGRLASGCSVPSTRALAAELGLSRNTVQAAYDQLVAEGYLEGRVGAGTRVALALSAKLLGARRERPVRSGPGGTAPSASRRGASLSDAGAPGEQDIPTARAFRPGLPAIDAFPFGIWARYVARRVRDAGRLHAGYGDPAGEPALREAIAAHLRATRGLRCEALHVIVTESTQHTLDLVARVVLDEGDDLWFEDPGYPRARAAFAAAGVRPVAVPVDAEGIEVAQGRRRAPHARGVYVTPSHQYPTGGALGLARRLELLAWAREAGAWVVEDDYDSEFRFAGHPLAALQGLDDDGRVLYLGTFSKVMYPSLRVAYLVAPSSLAAALARARSATARGCAAPIQAALADFMRDGAFAAHVRRMRALYAERRGVLLEELHERLAGALEPQASDTGLHVAALLTPELDDRAVSRRAAELGVDAPALSAYRLERRGRGGLVLGFAGSTAAEIREGVRSLGKAVASLTGGGSKR